MVIRRLVARDESARIDVVIEPGALIDSHQIHRNIDSAAEEVYVMEFESDGRHLRCALVQFQSRTQTAAPLSVDESPGAATSAAA